MVIDGGQRLGRGALAVRALLIVAAGFVAGLAGIRVLHNGRDIAAPSAAESRPSEPARGAACRRAERAHEARVASNGGFRVVVVDVLTHVVCG